MDRVTGLRCTATFAKVSGEVEGAGHNTNSYPANNFREGIGGRAWDIHIAILGV